MREVRRSNPGARVKMDYDKVEVGARSYVFDCEEGRVVQREQVRIGSGCKINKYTDIHAILIIFSPPCRRL